MMKPTSLWTRLLAYTLAFLLAVSAGLFPTTGMSASAPDSVIPIIGTPPTLISVTINNSVGDQFDPHVSGDWAAYTSANTIRYYNFVTPADAQIPLGDSARDLLSDVSGSRVVFARIVPSVKTAIMVFDAANPGAGAVEINPVAGSLRIGAAIGGSTVVYVDFALASNGELAAYDLSSNTTTRLTNDTAFDQNPSVSPDGTVVVWEHCASSMLNCDVLQSVFASGAWTTSVVTAVTGHEANPDTNGLIVIYDAMRSGERDLFWKPVGGGAEVQLQMAGLQENPSIAGNLVAIESRPDIFSTSDLFLYDITTNRLYQVTDTPAINEQLNDLSVLPDGRFRVVWATDEDGFDQRNVRAATFSLPGTDNTPPVLDPTTDVTVTLPLNSTATSMAVTFPTPTATDDSGTVNVTTSPVSGAVFPVGTTTVDVTATDGAGNTSTGSFTVTVLHDFSGFLPPVDGLPVINVVNAGQAIPVKFSLSGDKGLNIFAPSYPISSPVVCDANAPGAVIEETIMAGGSSLSYDALADRYSYVWKTDKAWKGSCRILALRLKDGSNHFAKFRFR